MGEAGPEAIMPLTNIGGSLGVRTDSATLRMLQQIQDAVDRAERETAQLLGRVMGTGGARAVGSPAMSTERLVEVTQRHGDRSEALMRMNNELMAENIRLQRQLIAVTAEAGRRTTRATEQTAANTDSIARSARERHVEAVRK
jgi:hypothetical protein